VQLPFFGVERKLLKQIAHLPIRSLIRVSGT
jgi:hypothetical protein